MDAQIFLPSASSDIALKSISTAGTRIWWCASVILKMKTRRMKRYEESSREVAETFTRIARAVRIINDERANLPDIADTEPERLSFLVAAAMEVEPEVKQEMLELRSTSERLRRLRDILARAVSGYEERARVHELAKEEWAQRKED